MLDFIEGNVEYIESDHVVISNNGIGFKVYMGSPYSLKENDKVKIYLYNQIKEDDYSLYGFKTKEERELFLRLINVKGLGPKIAMPILAGGSIDGVKDAIERENVLYLTKFPKVGDKLARQIILDLKGKLVSKEEKNVVNDEVTEALEALGYKKADINKVMKDVDNSLSIEQQIKEALKLMFSR